MSHHGRTLAVVAVVLMTGCKNDLVEADELLATGDPEGAAAIYRARLEKEPGDGAGLIGLSRALYTAALEKSKTGADTAQDWNEVLEIMDQAVLVDPAPEGVAPVDDALYGDALYRAGMKRYEAKDHAGAAEALAKAEDKGKKTADLYMALARAHAEAGQTEEALKAASRAAKLNPRTVEFFREAAGWAKGELPWVHHHFFYLAEQEQPTGFKFKAPIEITKGLVKKYGALNMVNDTLGLFLFNEEVDSRAWDGIGEREAVIADMDKFLGKKPPKAFDRADVPRLPWVVYHYYNTTGVVFAYLGADDKAREWFDKSRAVVDAGKVRHPDLSKEELEDQVGWAEANAALLQ